MKESVSLENIRSFILNGELSKVMSFLAQNGANLKDADVKLFKKSVKFWVSKNKQISSGKDLYEMAEAFQKAWREFYEEIVKPSRSPYKGILMSFKNYAYSKAIDVYLRILHSLSGDVFDAHTHLLIAKCYMEMEEYDRAIYVLKSIRKVDPRWAPALALLGDVFFLKGDVKKSKLFFREAFLVDPQEVPLEELKAPFLKRLAEKVEEEGYMGREIKEWMPIYGVIDGTFGYIRKLSQDDVFRLRREENYYWELYNSKVHLPIPAVEFEPRLINRKIWLIDYYALQVGDFAEAKKIGETLKIINRVIFEKLKKGVYPWL